MHLYQFLPQYNKLANGDHVFTRKEREQKTRAEEERFNWNNYNGKCRTQVKQYKAQS